ncbi:hypothetical protein AB0E55_08065 [Amycolatopsis keratiniphila]|uniref:hypothetical protein n=1 Tax=Amycolatopsis keratiniphila TaxID=129921 RepID=UPI0033E3C89B
MPRRRFRTEYCPQWTPGRRHDLTRAISGTFLRLRDRRRIGLGNDQRTLLRLPDDHRRFIRRLGIGRQLLLVRSLLAPGIRLLFRRDSGLVLTRGGALIITRQRRRGRLEPSQPQLIQLVQKRLPHHRGTLAGDTAAALPAIPGTGQRTQNAFPHHPLVVLEREEHQGITEGHHGHLAQRVSRWARDIERLLPSFRQLMPDLLREETPQAPGGTVEHTTRHTADRATDRRPLQRLGVPPVPAIRRDLDTLDTPVHRDHEPRAARRPLRSRRAQLPQLTTHLLHGELTQLRLQQLENPLNGEPGGHLHHGNEDRAEQRRQQLDDRRERQGRERDQHDLALLNVGRGVFRLLLEPRRLDLQLLETGRQITLDEAQDFRRRLAVERAIQPACHRGELIDDSVEIRMEHRPGVTDGLQPALAALRPLHAQDDLEEVLETRRQLSGLIGAVHRPLITTTCA